jgi:transcriptional regulator of NAD metabolism
MHEVQRMSSGEERRRGIVGILGRAAAPVNGSELARRLSVSRQVIVQDVALLRARGHRILATPRGYVLLDEGPRINAAIVACHSSLEELEDELATIVGLGGTVVDVSVEHPLYGELRGTLMLRTQEDVTAFLARMRATGAEPLSRLTRGVHRHTLGVPDEATLQKITEALRQKGYLVEAGGDASAAV